MAVVIRVGIAEVNVVMRPDSICTLGLGSCVGLVLFDEVRKLGGMVHVMLPSTELAKGKAFNPAKFADSGIPALVELVVKAGADRRRLIAKMAGGAQMFSRTAESGDSLLKIGPRNVDACRDILQKLNIPLVAEDTGGSFGRTIELFSENGMLEVRAIGRDKKMI